MAPPEPISPVNKVSYVDIQELTKAEPTAVPERFVKDVNERPTLLDTDLSSFGALPIINLSKLMNGNPDEFHSEILNLTTACEKWGFFQVINHGIDLVLLEKLEKVTKEFFMLPIEEKQKYRMEPELYQGYGQAFVFSESQKLDWCNMLGLAVEPPSFRKPHLWPAKPAEFSETLMSYSGGVGKLCRNLLKYMAISLGLKGDSFEEKFGVATQGVRINYYPPCSRPDLVMGLSAHSDGSGLTVLQQDKGSPVGLQIVKNNTWVPVQPIPDALVINVGDTLEVLTNGRYKSVEHRAVTNMEKDRLTIVTFYSPSYELELGPVPELLDENNPSKFRRYNHIEYVQNYVNNKLQGKKSLDFAKIEIQNPT